MVAGAALYPVYASLVSLLSLSLIAGALLAANIDVKAGDDLFGTLSKLKAGDQVTIHAGRYKVPGYVVLDLQGTEDQPIVIAGKSGEEVIVEGIPSQNTFNLSGSWFTLRDLKIEGGSHGVRLGTCEHVTLEGLEITAIGDVGISCNYPQKTCKAITIRRNQIHHTGQGGGPGECMYLGCNENVCQMWDSVIEYNWCHHTTAGTQGDGIELKTGSYNNIIRHNVIHDVKYPGITVYGTVDNKAPNIVEGNIIWGVQDNGIQMVGDAQVQNNIIFDVQNNAIQIKPSQGEIVENLSVQHNTVINPGHTCLRASGFSAGSKIHIANNALFCDGGMAMKIVGGQGDAKIETNAGEGSVEGFSTGFVVVGDASAAMIDPANKNTYPSKDSKLLDAGSKSSVDRDFNCRSRDPSGVDIGAYDHRAQANPGWMPVSGFKECSSGEDSGETSSQGTSTSQGSSTSHGASTNTDTTTGDETTKEESTKDQSSSVDDANSTADNEESSTSDEIRESGGDGKQQEPGAAGSGGCSCKSSGNELAGGLAAGLILSGAAVRRRRRIARNAPT